MSCSKGVIKREVDFAVTAREEAAAANEIMGKELFGGESAWNMERSIGLRCLHHARVLPLPFCAPRFPTGLLPKGDLRFWSCFRDKSYSSEQARGS